MARIWLEAWDQFEIHPQEPIELHPARFLVPMRQRAVTRSGLELDELFFYTVELADGRWRRIGLFNERNLAERFLAEDGD
jgi:hypothetical protein